MGGHIIVQKNNGFKNDPLQQTGHTNCPGTENSFIR
jgi:hypothetical protein